MIDSTAVRRLVTHMLCWSWAMYFSAAASSENDQGSMNLASNTAPSLHDPVQGGSHPRDDRVLTRRWTSRDRRPVLRSYQVPIELLGDGAELDDQIAGQVFRLGLAPLFPPEPDQGRLSLPMMIRASEPPIKLRRLIPVNP